MQICSRSFPTDNCGAKLAKRLPFNLNGYNAIFFSIFFSENNLSMLFLACECQIYKVVVYIHYWTLPTNLLIFKDYVICLCIVSNGQQFYVLGTTFHKTYQNSCPLLIIVSRRAGPTAWGKLISSQTEPEIVS